MSRSGAGPPVREAYDSAATVWRQGPERVYARLAEALVDVAPVPLAGALVLDVGAGTAVAARAALARGAAGAVATDVSVGMLAGRPAGVAAALADLARLPFGGGTFDLVTAAFCLGHLPDPERALVEMRRVAPAAVASAFAPGPGHPAKAAVDGVFARFGFTAPDWYRRQKEVLEPRVEDPELLRDHARAAGYRRVEVHRRTVETGLATPAEVVSWRVGMAHLAPFAAGLPAATLAQARAEAEQAVAPLLPVAIDMLALSAS